MTLHLSYTRPSGERRTVWLLPYQTVLVGSGSQSDEVCEFDSTMAPAHFQLASTGLRWIVRLMATNPSRLFVNGYALTGWEHPLEDGDWIQAGETRFEVTIEGISRRKLVTECDVGHTVAERPDPLPAKPLTFSRSPDSSYGIQLHWSAEKLPDVLKLLGSAGNLFATVNTKRLDGNVGELPLSGDDLFEMAPEEIRASDSLYLITIEKEQIEGLSPALLDCGRRGGLCLLVAEQSQEQLMQQMKIVWAWFSRPQNLEFHVRSGSSHLTQLLLGPVLYLIVASSDDPNRLAIFAEGNKLEQCEKLLYSLQARVSSGQSDGLM